jgi:hypothetical protein
MAQRASSGRRRLFLGVGGDDLLDAGDQLAGVVLGARRLFGSRRRSS